MATWDNYALPNPSYAEGLTSFLWDSYDIKVPPLTEYEGDVLVVWDNYALANPQEYEGTFYATHDGLSLPSSTPDGIAYVRHEGILARAGIPASYYISTRRGPVLEVPLNGSRNVYVFMRALDTGAGQAGLASTMVINASKNGAAGAVITPTITDLGSTLGAGWYVLALTSIHFSVLGEMALHITALAALPNDDVIINVIALDKQDGVRASLTALPNAVAATSQGLPTSEMVTNIAVTGAALNAIASSYVITTGNETGVLANTDALDGVFHTFTDVGGVIDIYYQFDVSAILNATGVSTQWKGYLNGATNTMNVYAWNWNTLAWDQIGTIAGTGDTTVYTADLALTNSHTSNGIARIRFANTGLTTATFATDRLLFGYAVTPPTPSTIASTLLDTSLTGHNIANTPGAALTNIVTPSAIAAAILNALRSGYVTTGTIGEGIAIATSLLQGNFYMDEVTNTANGQTNARMRCFHTGTAAQNATQGGSGEGEFATFLVTTSYSGPNKIIDHRVVQQ